MTYTISRFGTEMRKLVKELIETDPSQDALVKGRAGGGVYYQVNWTQLKAHLQGTRWYDSNAALRGGWFLVCWTSRASVARLVRVEDC